MKKVPASCTRLFFIAKKHRSKAMYSKDEDSLFIRKKYLWLICKTFLRGNSAHWKTEKNAKNQQTEKKSRKILENV